MKFPVDVYRNVGGSLHCQGNDSYGDKTNPPMLIMNFSSPGNPMIRRSRKIAHGVHS